MGEGNKAIEMPAESLFGTDGIRGPANVGVMSPETVLRLGRAAGHYFRTSSKRRHRVLIGKDTRISGYMVETALASGLCSVGVDVLLVGPMPTPGIAFLARSLRADAGIAISASHNPFGDNGIKFFGPDGFKLPDEAEESIEELVRGSAIDDVRPSGDGIGKAFRIDDAGGRYITYLKTVIPREMDFDGLNLVIDCAHGAGHRVAPAVLAELGAEVVAIGVDPDGCNINDRVGALHVEALCKKVVDEGADAGLALDGDADRVIMVDELGQQVDGDHILAILALSMKEEGLLTGKTVVGTVMSNLGLELLLAEHDLILERESVGDRYVVKRMREGGFVLGGEKSGHIVCLDHSTTGDGMVTALRVLAVMRRLGKPLSSLRKALKTYPQTLINIKVKQKKPLENIPEVAQAIEKVREQLGDHGRVLVRYSGTEALARVMVEAQSQSDVDRHANAVATAIRKTLGEQLG